MRLSKLARCFQGVCPATIATCDRDGTPNVTYLSQVFFVDEKHVALSCQFFNKTKRNVLENPFASVVVFDPVTFESFELDLRYDHAETDGPLFETMAVRIDAIASQTGMAGVFKLISADVYEVLAVRKLEGFLSDDDDEPPPPSILDPMTPARGELRGLQLVSERINRARDLDGLLGCVLSALRDAFAFEHSMVLLPDETGDRLFTVASLGYGESGIGAEVAAFDGLVGTAAKERRILRIADVDADLRYGRAIRKTARTEGLGHAIRPEIPLPGLPDAQSHMAIPLVVDERLVGVLAVEDKSPLGFDDWHEAFLGVVANQVAIAIERMQLREEEPSPRASGKSGPVGSRSVSVGKKVRNFRFYRNDDCVFVDGEYLIRNVPGRILWKILTSHAREGRAEFTNRELRMDPSLGLPPVKDNLESRLILLRKRLEERCPDVRMVSTGRGHFRLEVDCELQLDERDSP